MPALPLPSTGDTTVRTIQGALIQVQQLLNKPTQPQENTTLNQKLDLYYPYTLSDVDVPVTKYWCIGVGNREVQTIPTGGASQQVKVSTRHRRHRPRNTCLYDMVPFVLRRIDDDLAAIDRVKYRLRKVMILNGITYAAYYLKTFDLTNVVPTLELLTVSNGNTTTTSFTPALSDLSPTPPVLSSQGNVLGTGDYVRVSAKIQIDFTANEVTEYLNAYNILYGEIDTSDISEIGICSGVDKVVQGVFNGGVSAGYTDSVASRIMHFINVDAPLKSNLQGVQWSLDLGATEPMLA
jgi:hypothetical protein